MAEEPGLFQFIVPDEDGMPAPNPEAFKLAGLILVGAAVSFVLTAAVTWVVVGR